MKISQTNVLVLLVLATISPAEAADQGKALEEIASFSERICQTAPIKSSSEELHLTGKANAELKGLVSKIANLGISGAGEYKKAESEGVLQKDLAALLSKSADCKQKISDKLVDKLILNAAPEKKSYATKIVGNSAIPGQLSGVKLDIYIDDTQIEGFNNLKGKPAISAGSLAEGTHMFRFENIVGYFMHPTNGPQVVPQASGMQCDGQFVVSRSRTYQLVVWLDGSGLKCDLR